jgi:catechol 2,3-dioxygenase-like lactoylglutathione lyase family enzyme
MLSHIDHVNMVVEDLSRMTSFYRDILCLRVTKQTTIRGAWIERLTGFEKVEADVVYFEAASGPGLELICYRTPPGNRPPRLERPNTPGLRHVAFRVEDLEATVASLHTANVRFLSDIQQVPQEQVDYADKRKQIIYCLDPEENLLELCAFE